MKYAFLGQGQFSWSSANDGSTYYPFVYQNTGIAGVNCGQDSTFCGLLTAGGNADDNGFEFDWASEAAMSKSRSMFRNVLALAEEFSKQSNTK